MIFGTPPIVTNNLAFYLDAGNRQCYPGTGTPFNDLSSNQFSGNLQNASQYNTTNQGNLTFNGTQYIGTNATIGNGSTLSIEAWFKTTDTAGAAHILSKGNTNNYQYALRMGFSPSVSVVNFLAWTSVGNNYNQGLSDTGGLYNDGNWHQVVGTITEGVQCAIYGDGLVRSVSTTFSGSWNKNSGAIMRIGGRQDGINYFNGSIAIVRIYTKQLSDQEVAQNYNATKNRFGLT